MPPLEASWADSQRARHPIGPWSFVAGSNCRPMVYDTIALPTELTKHGRMFYTGYHPAIRVANPFFQYHSVATPMDSALYPLRCFPVSFATDTGTLEYSQAQHLRIRHQNISVVLRLTDGRERDGWCRTTVVRAYASHASHLHCHYCALSRD